MGKVCTWPARLANDFQALVAVPSPAGPCPVAVAFAVARVGFRGCPWWTVTAPPR